MKTNVIIAVGVLIVISILAVMTIGSPSIFGPKVPTEGLVAEWKLANNVNDTSEYGNDAAIMGKPNFVQGKIGRALSFNGNNELVTVPNAPKLNFGITKNFTISLWLKSTQSGTGDPAFGWLVDHRRNNDGLYTGYSIGDYAGKIEARIRDNEGHDVPVYSTSNVNDGKWHNLVYVVDRTVQAEKLYIDNSLESEASISSVGNIDTGFDLHLGGTTYPSTPLDFLQGSIDQVRIYDRALSASDIELLYTEGNSFILFQSLEG